VNDEAKIAEAVQALVDVGWMPLGAQDVVRQVMQDPKRIPDAVKAIEDAWRGSVTVRRSKIDRAVAALESFAPASPQASLQASGASPDAPPAKANG
jgi:hypothetical protein